MYMKIKGVRPVTRIMSSCYVIESRAESTLASKHKAGDPTMSVMTKDLMLTETAFRSALTSNC